MMTKGQPRCRAASAFAAGGCLFLLTAFLIIVPMECVAGAGDFSSHTSVPRGSYSGVKMQQGRPQSDNDVGRSMKSAGSKRTMNFHQRKTLRAKRIHIETRGKSAIIICGA